VRTGNPPPAHFLSPLFIPFRLQVNARLPFEGGTNLLGARSEHNRTNRERFFFGESGEDYNDNGLL
jgi:hypothetical protein